MPAAKKPAAKKIAAKKPAAKKPAAKKPRQQESDLFSLVADFDAAFDAEDNSPGLLSDFVTNAIVDVKPYGFEPTRDEMISLVARVRGLSAEELRGILDHTDRQDAAARQFATTAGKVSAPELAALRTLMVREGRFGATLDDRAAKQFATAWPRLAGEALGELFAGATDLRLTNVGPVASIEGLERAAKLTWLEIEVTPECDLQPLAKLSKLKTLKLFGKRENLGALALFRHTTALAVETTAQGLAELAKMPSLRVLELTVAPEVPLAGLLALPKLNLVTLLAGERPLDADLLETMAALAKKRKMVRLALHEKWPEALVERGIGKNVGWRVEIN